MLSLSRVKVARGNSQDAAEAKAQDAGMDVDEDSGDTLSRALSLSSQPRSDATTMTWPVAEYDGSALLASLLRDAPPGPWSSLAYGW